jgi:PadR family transcriptional regulator PadR
VGPSRFEFAPPRHFLLPAIILLLSEEPGYGYSLVKDLEEFRFGQVDRPSVYRALAQLEKDDLVTSWSEAPKAGQARRVYGLTEHGERVLRAWMGVIKEERDCLDRVLRRYQATGSTDAVLAEVEGGWSAVLGQAWSSVSSTSPTHRRLARSSCAWRPTDAMPVAWGGRFAVVPERSVVLVEARSTVGPISFGSIGVTGFVEADRPTGADGFGVRTAAHLEIAVRELRSGNSLYDAELLRRIDARRFPIASIDLCESTAIGSGDRYRLSGDLTFHGVTRPVQGTVTATLPSDRKLVVSGEQVFDIREFEIASPTVLMLRIYPDVRVHLHVEAELEE